MECVHESPAIAEAVVPLVFPFTRGGYRHTTATPEVFLAQLGRGAIPLPRLPGGARPRPTELGLLVLPIVFAATCPEPQLAAVVTLPRDRILSRQDVEAAGTGIENIPPARWAEIATPLPGRERR